MYFEHCWLTSVAAYAAHVATSNAHVPERQKALTVASVCLIVEL